MRKIDLSERRSSLHNISTLNRSVISVKRRQNGKEIDHLVIVDSNDLNFIQSYSWRIMGDGPYYAFTRGITGETVRMHRLILGAAPGQVVDHINGNGLDNRRENLRICTQAENVRNRRKFNTGKSASQYIGVHHTGSLTAPRPWYVHIRINGKPTHVGCFASELEAAHAYDSVTRKHHGQFARLNFPTPIEDYFQTHPLATGKGGR